ncbi:VTT domain-containing protein [Tissierella sp.]|uniref:VTT domain-containing protein n=1 Tax=Tissierella sp. TaxID=41274 RepID=UPI0028B17CD0|nr:VTT domain-containing protein [Tissierella sp.]
MKSVIRINKKYLYLSILLLTVLLYIAYKPFKSIISEIALLFTSNSSESIVGYLNSYDIIRPIVSIGLMILQALIIPFKYEIMIFANIKVFGALIGIILSLIGRIIGAYVCFDIGKTLISNGINLLMKKININNDIIINDIRNSSLVHIFVRILPLNFDLISYIMGILQLDLKKYMINSIIWITITTIAYSLKKGYYSYSYEIGIIFIRLALSVVVFAIATKKHYKKY